MAGDGGGGGHGRADQMGAAAFALAAFKVAVAGAGAALAGGEDVGIHAQAHAAACFAPIETGFFENAIEPFFFSLLLHLSAAGDDHGADVFRHVVTADDSGGGTQIFDAAVGAGADEYAVQCQRLHRLAGFQTHVFERLSGGFALIVALEVGWIGDTADDRNDLAWVGAPTDLRGDIFGIVNFDAVVFGAGIAGELAPAFYRCVKVFSFRSELAAFYVFESGFVGGDHAGAGAGFDRHVADGHTLFHGKTANDRTGVFDDVTGATVGADLTDEEQDDVFGGDAAAEMAVDAELEGFGFGLEQRLCGQDVFHFAGADAKGESAERAVSGGVAVAANDGHAWLGDSKLGADDVDDALLRIVEIVEADAEFFAVVAECVDLLLGNDVGNRQAAVGRRNVVIGGGDGEIRAADFTAGKTEAFEGLRLVTSWTRCRSM